MTYYLPYAGRIIINEPITAAINRIIMHMGNGATAPRSPRPNLPTSVRSAAHF